MLRYSAGSYVRSVAVKIEHKVVLLNVNNTRQLRYDPATRFSKLFHLLRDASWMRFFASAVSRFCTRTLQTGLSAEAIEQLSCAVQL